MPTAKNSEVWKSPPSLYKWWVEVSNMGRVRTLDRYVYVRNNKGGERHYFKKGRILKLACDSRGRPIYSFVGGGRLIRDLVAECFVPKTHSSDKWVFHKDGNPKNCKADNLCWGCSLKDHHIIGRLVGAYRNGENTPFIQGGLTFVANKIGVTKQAIHIAIKKGRRCNGVLVKYIGGKKRIIMPTETFPISLYDD